MRRHSLVPAGVGVAGDDLASKPDAQRPMARVGRGDRPLPQPFPRGTRRRQRRGRGRRQRLIRSRDVRPMQLQFAGTSRQPIPDLYESPVAHGNQAVHRDGRWRGRSGRRARRSDRRTEGTTRTDARGTGAGGPAGTPFGAQPLRCGTGPFWKLVLVFQALIAKSA